MCIRDSFEIIENSSHNRSWDANSKTLWKLNFSSLEYKFELDSSWILNPTYPDRFGQLSIVSQDTLLFGANNFLASQKPVPPRPIGQITFSIDGGVNWKFISPPRSSAANFVDDIAISEQFLYLSRDAVLYQIRISDVLFGTIPIIQDTFYYCENSSIQVGNQIFSEPQIAMVSNGCDSLILIEILEAETYSSTVDTTINIGEFVNGFPMQNDTSFWFRGESIHGCDSSILFRVTVDKSSSVNDQLIQNNIQIYPNPTNSQTELNIVFNKAIRENTEIKIIDSFGKTITTEKLSSGQNQYKLDLPPIQSGVYFVQISELGHQPILKKLILLE